MKLYYNSMQCSKIWEHYLIEIPDKISTTFRIYPCWNRLRRNNKKHSNFHQWFKNVQIEKNKILPRLTFFYSLSTRIPSYERKERKEGSKILEGMDEEIIASWGHRSIEADNFVAGNSNWRDPMRATFIKLVRPTFLSFFLSPRTGGRYVSEKQKLQQTRALFSSVPTDEKRVNDSRTRWYHKLDGLRPLWQVCATAFWNNDHRRNVFVHIRREGVHAHPRWKSFWIFIFRVYICVRILSSVEGYKCDLTVERIWWRDIEIDSSFLRSSLIYI